MECKQGDDLREQEGLPEELIKELLIKRDWNKAYKCLFELAVIYYHLQGKDRYAEAEEFFNAFPFCQHLTDGAVVCVPLLEKYDKELNIWNPKDENKIM